MLQRLSLTARLSLFFTSLACVVLLALGWLIGVSIEQHFEEQDRHALSGKLELAQHIIERVETEEDLQHLQTQLSDALVGHHDLMIHILDNQQRAILSSDHHRFPVEILNGKTGSHANSINVSPISGAVDTHALPLRQWQSEGQSYRGLVTQFNTKNPIYAPITVAIATDIAHHQSFMRTFMKTLWLFVAGAAVLTALLAWVAASRGLGPLRTMGQRASTITADKLDQRLAIDAVPPELADLAEHLNKMLERLQEAFDRLSAFSSDLAHELRTPISNLMMQTQVSLSQPRDAQSYREILESNAEEYARLARMISDMLFLAKAENGAQLVHCEPVQLDSEIKALFEFYEILAEEKTLHFHLTLDAPQASDSSNNTQDCQTEHFTLEADRLMLRRAFSNILSNAIRHAQTNSTIEVSLAVEADYITVSIENSGDTIAADQLTRLFERFYRGDYARQHASGEGAGLGLAIVQAIVRGHHGSISAQSEQGRTRFTLLLPRQQHHGKATTAE